MAHICFPSDYLTVHFMTLCMCAGERQLQTQQQSLCYHRSSTHLFWLMTGILFLPCTIGANLMESRSGCASAKLATGRGKHGFEASVSIPAEPASLVVAYMFMLGAQSCVFWLINTGPACMLCRGYARKFHIGDKSNIRIYVTDAPSLPLPLSIVKEELSKRDCHIANWRMPVSPSNPCIAEWTAPHPYLHTP